MLDSLNRQNFFEQLGRFSTSQLEDLTKQFPYQHELQLLLAKKYQLENNPAFDEQLQIAAIYAQDRELFYSLFNEIHQQTADEEQVKAVAAELYMQQPAIVNIEDPAQEITIQAESGFEPLVVEDVEEPAVEAIEEEPAVVAPAEAVEEELPAVNEAVAFIPEVNAVEPVAEVEEVAEPAPAEEVIEVNLAESEHTFDEWLQVLNKTKAVIEEVVEEAAREPEEDDLDRLILENTPVNYLHELVEEETQYSKGLEQFIGEQKRKKRQQAEMQKVRDENEIDPSLATETLAKLYEMQRKYARAIRTYEALTLKFPEKSDFFAARINYLKNLM
jgi:hypothetical protein